MHTADVSRRFAEFVQRTFKLSRPADVSTGIVRLVVFGFLAMPAAIADEPAGEAP